MSPEYQLFGTGDRGLLVPRTIRTPAPQYYSRVFTALGVPPDNERLQTIAILVCLIKAFAKFLVEGPSRLYRDTFSSWRNPQFTEADIPLEQQLREWYLWLQTPGVEFNQLPPDSVSLSMVNWIGGVATGNWKAEEVREIFQDLPTEGLRVGPEGPDPASLRGNVIPLFTLSTKREFLPVFGDLLNPSQIRHWRFSQGDDTYTRIFKGVLNTPRAKHALDSYINEAVRHNMTGRCADASKNAALAFPDFTSIFRMTYYLVPFSFADVAVVAVIHAPLVEELLDALPDNMTQE